MTGRFRSPANRAHDGCAMNSWRQHAIGKPGLRCYVGCRDHSRLALEGILMNSQFIDWRRMPARSGLIVAAALFSFFSLSAHALIFDWQEQAWPAENMQLFKVAASPERLLAIGRVGVSPDFEPVAVTSTDGRNWQIIDLDLAGRLVSDILHTDDGFILALEDGSLRIGGPDQGWDEIVPPDEARLRLASVVDHQGRILLFGQRVSSFRTSRIVGTEDFLSWDVLWEGSDLFVGPFLIDPVSSGAALAMMTISGPPTVTRRLSPAKKRSSR